jgi:class I lanthipeptide synthase
MTSAVASPPKTQALSEGALGMALLSIECGDQATARRLVATAVTGGVSVGANASLFHGAPALEFVLGRAQRTNHIIQNAVDRVVAARLAAAARRREAGRFPHLAEFDLIRGLAGLGALLLTRPSRSGLIEEVLAALVTLAQPVESDGRPLPGWWSADSPGHEQIAGGHSDNGMAHGIAGPLALLSLATGQGVEVEGQREAIVEIAGWLGRYGAAYWTTHDQVTADEPPRSAPSRPSWCYGVFGIARALHLAAIALEDPTRRQAAEDMALAALNDADRLSLINDASLCHGWAGILAVTRAIAADGPIPRRFAAHIDDLRRRVANEIGALTKPGFLEGRAGAQLALGGTDATGWTRTLLIA